MSNKSNKTVLHIAPTPFFADHGCHIRIRNEIEALAAKQIRVLLCTYHHGRDINGIETRRILTVPGYSKLDAGFSPFKFIADALLFFLVLKTAWQERPVVLHGHLHEGALIGWAVKICLFWRRLPVIMDMQGSLTGELVSYGTLNSRQLLTRVALAVERLIYRLPAFVFCSSEQSRNTLISKFKIAKDKTALLQDVVPDFFFNIPDSADWKQLHNIPADKKIILYTGSLLPGKGVHFVLESVKNLCLLRDDLFFILAGYPVEDAQEFITEHHLTESILLTGQVAYSELHHWLAVGDVALEPKEDESGEASGKLLHYMATGLPVVCFDTMNNRKFLANDGYYALPGDEDSFAGAIESAVNDMPEARKRGGRKQAVIRKTYSSAAIGTLLQKQYDRLTG